MARRSQVTFSKDLGVVGTVRWDDGSGPIPEVLVELFGVHRGRPEALGRGRTDQAGRFALELDEVAIEDGRLRLNLPSFVVRTAEGSILTQTPTACAAITDCIWTAAISVPTGRRGLLDPTVEIRPTTPVGPIEVDAARLADMTRDDLIAIARLMVDPEAAAKHAPRIEALSPQLNAQRLGPQTLCLTPLLEAVEEIVRLKEWPRELLLEVDAIIRRLDSGFATYTHDCGNFSVTYQTSGPAAVDTSTDALDILDPGTTTVLDTIPAGGSVPTYIRLICWWANRALNSYITAPFSLKNPAASGKIAINVTSTDFGGASPSGFTIGNSLGQEILAAVTVHELFHMVQYEYGLSGAWYSTMMEGGAVFSEDVAADAMNRYLYEASSPDWSGTGILPNPNRSLKTASYDAALLLRYIAEQQSADVYEPFVGVETYRRLIEECESGGASTASLETAIRSLPWYQDFYRHHYLDPARQDRTNSETVLGNYALACYLKDSGVNEPDGRFDFIEDEEEITFDQIVNGVLSTPVSTFATMAEVDISGSGTVNSTSSVNFSGSVNDFASRYYEVDVDSGLDNIEVQFTAGAGLTSLIFQIALIDENGEVRDIHRTDATSYTKRITSDRDGTRLSKLALVVTGADSSGSFSLSAAPAAPTPDVMVTRWHSAIKTEYEIDPSGWSWTWVSPDVWVDNDADGAADGTVYFDFDNKLHIRLHNKGNADASGIQIELWYQDASGGLSDAAWLPVKDKAGTTQVLTGLSLAAGTSKDWQVDWSPSPSGGSDHFCIRAVVTAPGDPNTDNKRVLSNFGSVVVHPGGWVDLTILRRNVSERLAEVDTVVVPRLPHGLELALRDLRSGRAQELKPGAVSLDRIRLTHLGETIPRQGTDPRRFQGGEGCRVPLREEVPDVRGHYPTDPRALPPGVADMPLVTVAHRQDGLVTGGVTLMVTEGDGDSRPPRQQAAR